MDDESISEPKTKSQELGAYEVLVRVKAVSLNYRDLLIAKGLYTMRLSIPKAHEELTSS